MVTRNRLSTLLLALGATLSAFVLMFAAPAAAMPSGDNSAWQTSRIDAQLKPEFKALLHHGCCRPVHYCPPGQYRDQYGQCYCPQGLSPDGYGQCVQAPCPPDQGFDPNTGTCICGDGQYPDDQGYCPSPQSQSQVVYGWAEHLTVDCRNDPQGGNPVAEALDQLSDGGTLHLKGRGPSCTGTLHVHRPVVIVGERPSMFALEGDAGRAVLVAPPGAPCAIIDAGSRGGVEFRNITFEAMQGGRTACVQIEQTKVGFTGSGVHYKGESSAIYARGGELRLYDTEVTSSSLDAAVWTEATALIMERSGISAAGTGLDVLQGPGQVVKLDHAHIVGVGSGLGGDPTAGIIGRRVMAGDTAFKIEDSHIEGFRTGLLFERGARPDITHARIVHSRIGIAIDGATVSVHDSVIEATEYGAYAYSGILNVDDTKIASVQRCPVAGDAEAEVHLRNVEVFADHCACRGVGPGMGTSAEAGLHFHLRAELKIDLGLNASFSARHWGWDR